MTKELENLFDLNKELNDLIENKISKIILKKDGRVFFVAFVFAKAFKTHRAILLLCQQKHGEDAFMLARTLLELMITTAYILRDKTKITERLTRYLEHNVVFQTKHLRYQAEKNPTESIKAALVEQEKEYKRLVDKHRYNGDSWSDKSFLDMAKEINKADTYQCVYRPQCNVSHSNARSAQEYLRPIEQGFEINLDTSDNLVDWTLFVAFDSFHSLIAEIDEIMALELKEILYKLYERFGNLAGRMSITT